MKTNQNKIPTYGKIIGALMFIGVFAFNLSTFIGQGENGLSLNSLKAYAATGSSAPVLKYACLSPECSITYNIKLVTVTEYGHYSHCSIASEGNCVSSSCDKKCDAGDGTIIPG
jgi:hypothetical protein